MLAVGAGIGWGTLAPVAKLLFTAQGGTLFNAFTLSVARAVWAIPPFVLLAIFTRPRGRTIERADWPLFAAGAVLVGLGLNFLYQLATQHTSAAHTVLLQGLAPLAVAAFEALFLGRRLDRVRSIALALGVCGVAAIAAGHNQGGAHVAGDAIMLAWLAVFASYSYVMRRLTGRYPTAFVTAVVWGAGFALVAILGAPLVPVAVAHSFATPDVTIAILVALVVVSALLAPAAHAAAVRRTNVTLATVGSQYAAIATGTVLALTVVHESLGPFAIAGGLLLVVALAVSLVPSRAEER
ncbi:MAG: DMT family transporter [Candidatus Eremiobacteraeota bacterium]|nr:DMT family transporter [Candidatus Eremiobacteraeota bacterium]